MLKTAGTLLLVAALNALGSLPARAEPAPAVDPLPAEGSAPPPAAAGSPEVGPAPALAAPPSAAQARDDEAPAWRPAAPSPRVFNRSKSVDPEPGAAQVLVGILVSGLAVAGGVTTYFATGENPWYAGAVLLAGAAGTGAVACALGQTSPTRHGGCRASLLGALIGVVGVLPGVAMLRASSGPCTATGPNADDSCATGAAIGALVGVSVGAIGYTLGTAFGAKIGWDLGATDRIAPPTPVAGVSLLSLRF